MVTHTVSKHFSHTLTIGQSNSTWNITDTSRFIVPDGNGIALVGDSNTVTVSGEIYANDPTKSFKVAAVNVTGDDNVLTNHGTLHGKPIRGCYGVLASGDHFTLNNDGVIYGREGVGYYGAGTDISIVNGVGGKITGVGLKTAPSAMSVNTTSDASNVDIVNKGVITGQVVLQGANVHFVNRGTIESGTLYLQASHSIIDLRGGKIDNVNGLGVSSFGNSDDVYIMDKLVDINDQGGHDKIVASFSYKLEDYSGIEDLQLGGGKDLRAAGNIGNNTVIGNSGDNRLSGGFGHDVLTGGEGRDEFIFRNGYLSIVTVSDYTDGVDKIHLDGFTRSFGIMMHHAEQHGNDVVISFQHDVLTLKNTHVGDLDVGDFIFT